MNCRAVLSGLLATLLLAAGLPAAHAQQDPPRLTPEQREEVWRRMTPEQRERFWRGLSPEQRQAIREQIPPEQREAMRQQFRQEREERARRGIEEFDRREPGHRLSFEERQRLRDQIREAHRNRNFPDRTPPPQQRPGPPGKAR